MVDLGLSTLRKIINLKLLLVSEILYSFSPYFYKRYLARWRAVPMNELEYLQKNFGLRAIKKIVLIGGGAIPYTAIFLNKILRPEIFVIIEKSAIASLAATRLLKKLDLANCRLIRARGEDYSEYDNSLVIVALQVTAKQKIVDKILNASHRSILIVRQPLERGRRVFETAALDSLGYATIGQERDFESVILAKQAYERKVHFPESL